MSQDAELLIGSTLDAGWLPQGGRADVIRSSVAPSPASLVRLLLRRGSSVFCVRRDGSEKLDLPTQRVPPSDSDGREAAQHLVQFVLGAPTEPKPIGFVRNVVTTAAKAYEWPTPHAHFTLWAADGSPVIPGTWVDIGTRSELSDRHWFPLLE
ncbi:MAG: NUDIX hydrolase [Rhodoglobus sp.]